MNVAPHNIAPVSADIGLLAWLSQAMPGDVLEYHRGFLILDRSHHTSQLKEDDRQVLGRVANLAMRLSDRGLVHLVQRRIKPDCFSYLTVARPRDGGISQFLDAE